MLWNKFGDIPGSLTVLWDNFRDISGPQTVLWENLRDDFSDGFELVLRKLFLKFRDSVCIKNILCLSDVCYAWSLSEALQEHNGIHRLEGCKSKQDHTKPGSPSTTRSGCPSRVLVRPFLIHMWCSSHQEAILPGISYMDLRTDEGFCYM